MPNNKPIPLDPDDNDTITSADDVNDGFYIDMESIVTELIPAGTKVYATIQTAERATSSSGNPMMKLRWKIDDQNAGDFDGKSIFDTLVWSANTMDRVKRALIAFGFDPKVKGKITPEALRGLGCVITIGQQYDETKIDPNTDAPYEARNVVRGYKRQTSNVF